MNTTALCSTLPSPGEAPAVLARNLPQPVVPVRTDVAGWCKLTGMGRTSAFAALARGDLKAVKLGSKTLIDVAHGLAWLDSLPPARTHKQAA